MKSTKILLIIWAMTLMILSCGTKAKDTPIRFANYNMRELMAVDTADRAFYNRLPLIVKRNTEHDFDINGTQEVTY